MIQQAVHGWIKAVLVLKLQGQAFAQVAGKDANGLKPLQRRQNLFDLGKAAV
jgi:hypothetical protein